MSSKGLTPEQQEKIFPTRWTSTQRGPAYMVRAKDLNPAALPGQRVTGFVRDETGTLKEASVPHCYYEKWIDEAGNVRTPPMRTARAMEEAGPGGELVPMDNGPYKEQMRAEFYRRGWLHYETGSQGEDRQKWVARREQAIADRQKKQKVENDRVNANMPPNTAQLMQAFVSAGSQFISKGK